MDAKNPPDGASPVPPENPDGQGATAAAVLAGSDKLLEVDGDADATGQEPRSDLDFPVVGVGASAGGIEALSKLLEHLPPDPGMAFVLVLHLDPHHESMVTTILRRSARMPVQEAFDRVPVKVNHVYVIPPNATVALSDGHLNVQPRHTVRAPHMPIDYLFRSLAELQQHRAIGVVLSGGGTDGTLGLQEISAREGITFAQDAESAKHDAMPRSAIGTGCVDFVMSPQDIAGELLRIAGHPGGAAGPVAADTTPADDEAFTRIFSILRQLAGIDFAQYKFTTVNRRIRRRVGLRKLETVADYAKYLEDNPEEVQALYQDLLIRVTRFFRDPAAFQALREVVFPRLLERHTAGAPLRVWVAGCATGEEVYSIAIALLEFLGEKAADIPIKILASDINATALEKARAGVYIENIELDVSAERLRRFFVKGSGYYQIIKSVRDLCVFCQHNLVRDPPFSRIDLVTCRNVLIYLGLPLQKRVVPIFHYALNPGGFLMLGNSETIGAFGDLFELMDDKQKIYLKKAKFFSTLPFDVQPGPRHGQHHAMAGSAQAGATPDDATPEAFKEADRLVLQKFAPPGVVVDQDFNVMQFRGHTDHFLEHAPGVPTFNLLHMARDGLRAELRNLLNEVKIKKVPLSKEGVMIRDGGHVRRVTVHVAPVHAAQPSGATGYLVLFDEIKAVDASPPSAAPAGPEQDAHNLAAQLKQELDATREFLQAMIEEHESTTEELKSANEESLSSNEELQSTNEELQSAKEELQSTNEELITVNEEVNRRNQELGKANDDLSNLFAGVKLPIVIVDRDLRVRRVTALGQKLFNLIPTDVGRPLSSIRSNLDIPTLDESILDVVDTLNSREVEAQDRQGKWYSVRIVPYITQDNKIDGASIIALDIDPLKRSVEQARLLASEQAARTAAESANRAKDEFLAMLAHEMRNPLGSLVNALYLLAQPAATPVDTRRMLDIAQRQARHLARMLDDLLDVSRLSMTRMRLQREPVAVRALVDRAVESTRALFEGSRDRIDVRLPPAPLWLDGDPVRLEQVLVNLLNNAVKFTPREGRVTLTVAAEDHVLVFRVKDTGMGIAPDMLPRVFDLFSQAEQSLDRAKGGLGIGLTLVKRIVELHGGTVEAASKGPGQGSEFVVRLPALDGQPSAARAGGVSAAPGAVPARDVLIVDDTRDGADSLAMLMRAAGHKVRVALDGEQALEAARAAPPQVVLLDIGLPGMDGFTVARRLREMPAGKKTLLVAVTGYGRDEDRERSREAGFDHHLVKPIDVAKVQELLRKLPGAN